MGKKKCKKYVIIPSLTKVIQFLQTSFLFNQEEHFAWHLSKQETQLRNFNFAVILFEQQAHL